MTRPDLDAIERRVTDMDAEEDAWRAQLHFAKNARADVLTLLTYCRELEARVEATAEAGVDLATEKDLKILMLEAENKRLREFGRQACHMRDEMDGHYVPAEAIFVFDGAREELGD